MMIIFYHTTDRDPYSKFIKNTQCYIYLASSTIHQKQIRHSGKAVKFSVAFMCKPPCQNLFHTCIIVRTLHRFNAKLTVIAALWLSFLINNHGTYGFKSTDIRDIKSFHSIKIFKAKPIFHFMNRSDRSAFFPSNTLTVLLQNHSRILPCKFNKLFLGSFFGHNNTNFLFSSGCQPFLNNIRIFYLCLQCNLSRNKRCTGIKLLYKTGQYL